MKLDKDDGVLNLIAQCLDRYVKACGGEPYRAVDSPQSLHALTELANMIELYRQRAYDRGVGQ